MLEMIAGPRFGRFCSPGDQFLDSFGLDLGGFGGLNTLEIQRIASAVLKTA